MIEFPDLQSRCVREISEMSRAQGWGHFKISEMSGAQAYGHSEISEMSRAQWHGHLRSRRCLLTALARCADEGGPQTLDDRFALQARRLIAVGRAEALALVT